MINFDHRKVDRATYLEVKKITNNKYLNHENVRFASIAVANFFKWLTHVINLIEMNNEKTNNN